MPSTETKVRLYAPSLKTHESFGLAHAERILSFSDLWELPANSEYEFVDYEIKLKETKRDIAKPDKKAGAEQGA